METTEKTAYSKKNPPPSLEEAECRREELVNSIGVTETKLQFNTANDFSCEAEFVGWRSRAMTALGFMRVEKTYLDEFILVHTPWDGTKASKQQKYAAYTDLTTFVEDRIDEYAYSEVDALPVEMVEDRRVLLDRRAQLLILSQRIEADKLKLSSLRERIGARKTAYEDAKEKLHEVYLAVHKEILLIKAIVRNDTE